MAPTTVIASQLNALQRNDYPDVDSGIKAAYAFTKPYECEEMISGQVCTAATAAAFKALWQLDALHAMSQQLSVMHVSLTYAVHAATACESTQLACRRELAQLSRVPEHVAQRSL